VPLRWITPADIVAQQALLRHPDFVVARMKASTGRCGKKCSIIRGVFVAPTSCVNPPKAEVLIAGCRLAAIMPPAFAFAKQIIRLLLGRL
jgi:hypothetical protein